MNKHLPTNKDWVLITGGSHGIGRALTLECSRRGLAVVVVALPDRHLENVRQELRSTPGAIFETIGLDLTAATSIGEVVSTLEERRVPLKYLINNAGFGRGGLIEHTPWAEYLTMMQLNNQVMVGLTLALLPLLKQQRGGIMNMSSMEATLPLPYKTVYTGTKAFVYNYSLALRQELRYYDVGVTVLCPGPVITNEDGLKRVEAMGNLAKVLVTMPEDIAPGAVAGFLKNKDVIRPGLLVRAILGFAYVVPRGVKMRILERLFSKYREAPQPEEADVRTEQNVPVG
ncbi:SDR family NAD(P)-dependent oxidoreductase [Neolewinella antarctica]|uniref:Uncharacterized protein n=1 Tax=Neolewinella antarctica TaxID=442734 RepID=A0ABX0XBW1_9BACT|nr:SDR family NAD(P)-dependent oxidoreductase [Neolewinella antarctica]NJC26434.1 hypothetical protein [Neolewinella antarctica]